jgi:hypothetical protein
MRNTIETSFGLGGTMRATVRFLRVLLICTLAAPVLGEDAQQELGPQKGLDFFEAKIRPALVKHCLDCHSPEAGVVEGNLRLDTREGVRKGGDRGPAVVPFQPEKSWLLKALSHADDNLKMPPKEKRLADSAIADFETWIKLGAPDPREEAEVAKAWTPPRRDFWAYQAPKRGKLPTVPNTDWPKRDQDAFLLAKLEEQDLKPTSDAEPAVLLRRLHFDLVGLPAAPQAIQRFHRRIRAEGFEAALEKETDELLASPRFGEHWGRHWLDVARYGESSGGEANITFPYAFRYRDYVIDSFNADLPYNRFLTEQIAGDLLPFETDEERARLLIATGFLAVGPKRLDEGNGFQFLADLVDEQIDSLSRAVLASSIACARCHDHKFDPFTMQDYYSLAGIFVSTKTYFGTAVSPANRTAGDPLVLPRLDDQPIFHSSIRAKQVEKLKAELQELKDEEKRRREAVWKAVAEGKDPSELFTITDALRIFWRTGAIEGQLEKVDEEGNALPLAMGALDRETIHDAPLLKRGDINQPGDTVDRGFPEVLSIGEEFNIPADESGRLQLARWLTHPQHPLTARVMVNRVWQHLFGAGLVRTVDNLGSTGEMPSHPELLDHLAVRFVEQGWSIKRLIREMVLSRTYRQASVFRESAFLKDPDNRLLWRMPKKRLPAESLRDAMLAASGELDPARPEGSLVAKVIGDRPVSLVGLDKRIPADLDGSVHRSVYLPILRDRLPEVLELFNFAEPSLVTGQREVTNVPLQALYLMNSEFVHNRSKALAARLEKEAATTEDRIELAFRLCFGRAPLEEERQRSLEFLDQREINEEQKLPVLVRYAQALLSTAEFRNLD